METFYKRTLPSSCIAFDSLHGISLFKQSMIEQNLECYFTLSLQYLTQSEPAYCGLSTLCMILNAAEIDPRRQWKGVWRWYDESMLECCRSLTEIIKFGVNLNEFVCLAKCNGLITKLNRAQLR